MSLSARWAASAQGVPGRLLDYALEGFAGARAVVETAPRKAGVERSHRLDAGIGEARPIESRRGIPGVRSLQQQQSVVKVELRARFALGTGRREGLAGAVKIARVVAGDAEGEVHVREIRIEGPRALERGLGLRVALEADLALARQQRELRVIWGAGLCNDLERLFAATTRGERLRARAERT